MKKLALILFALLLTKMAIAQDQALKEVSISSENLSKLVAAVVWGQINIEPSDTDTIKIEITYENAAQENLSERLDRLQVEVLEEELVISSPHPPKGKFESYLLNIKVPAKLDVKLSMEGGGEIRVTDISGGIEIDNLNGSTYVDGASSWLTINNFNGEISVSYSDFTKVKSISLITFNGGIQLRLPNDIDADAILLTKKHGWIYSDFPVTSTSGKAYTNMPRNQYAKRSNKWKGRIGAGGTKIIAMTNNGPIELLKQNTF